MSRSLRRTVVLGGLIVLANMNAQPEGTGDEKVLLIRTLHDLMTQFTSFDVEGVPESIRRTQWLLTEAGKWRPARKDEGRGLRQSLQLMVGAIRQAPRDRDSLERLMPAVVEDLREKRFHCEALGLGSTQKVQVKTLRGGITEVKGLEVWYLEKFLAGDPKATPHRFRSFSSPVVEDIVPGRYVFWSADPVAGRAGKRVDQRVGAGPSDQFPNGKPPALLAIEVLTP
jgi:hypothetical protein